MKTTIYKAQISTPFGELTFAVDSTEFDAKTDLLSAAIAEINCPPGMLRVKDISKSNRRILVNMTPVKKARSNDDYWAWVQKEKAN